MKVYIDTGVFLDHIIDPTTPQDLRTVERRGRSPERLRADAGLCLLAIRERHAGITSTLTCYEVEEAVYRATRRSKFAETTERLVIDAARGIAANALEVIDYFRIRVSDLSLAIVRTYLTDARLRDRGIRAADALHITTAMAEGAQVFITGDGRLMALDGVFAGLRCLDTDAALALLA